MVHILYILVNSLKIFLAVFCKTLFFNGKANLVFTCREIDAYWLSILKNPNIYCLLI